MMNGGPERRPERQIVDRREAANIRGIAAGAERDIESPQSLLAV